MPIFEYRCEACSHLEEVLQKHTDPAPEVCPKCGKAGTMAKEMSLTSFQLKGGGWYKDLYASSSKSDASASSSSASSSSTESKKSDSGSGSSGGSSSSGSSGSSSSGSSGSSASSSSAAA
jgi:putative FmdB family regulatory protein